MAKKSLISTNWYPYNRLLVTEISGDIQIPDVLQWQQSFNSGLEKIENGMEFKMLVNLFGSSPANFDVHMQLRSVVPATLVNFGWRVGYINMFTETVGLLVTKTRGIKCIAAAHVHQDADKMETYESRFGKSNEHFFADSEKAYDWIRKFNKELIAVPETSYRPAGTIIVQGAFDLQAQAL